MAAVETIRRGYQRFIIAGAASENNIHVTPGAPVAYTSGQYQAYGNTIYGRSTTTYQQGAPIISGSHDSQLAVLLLNPGDAGFGNGIDAKRELGADWEKIVKNGVHTCAD